MCPEVFSVESDNINKGAEMATVANGAAKSRDTWYIPHPNDDISDAIRKLIKLTQNQPWSLTIRKKKRWLIIYLLLQTSWLCDCYTKLSLHQMVLYFSPSLTSKRKYKNSKFRSGHQEKTVVLWWPPPRPAPAPATPRPKAAGPAAAILDESPWIAYLCLSWYI